VVIVFSLVVMTIPRQKGVLPEELRPYTPVKGESKNPSGKSRVVLDSLRYARSKSKEAMIVLWCIANDDAARDQDKIRAIELLLDRALGKPAQMNVNFDAVGMVEPNQIGQLARAVMRQIESGASGEEEFDAIETEGNKFDAIEADVVRQSSVDADADSVEAPIENEENL
jgi:hypothetical protein